MVDISKHHKAFTPTQDGNQMFCEAAHIFGLSVPYPAIDDGTIQRIEDRENKKAHNKNGWYTLAFEGDIYFGAYGSWSRGVQKTFCSVAPSKLTFKDDSRIKARQAAMQAEARRIHEETAKKAEEIIEKAPPANPSHEYLLRKKIKPHGIFQKGMDLLIPATDIEKKVKTYQTIQPNGEKRFLKDGESKGAMFQIGDITPVICVAEGYATAATIHELTGKCVFAAFNAGNMPNVCRAIREKYKGHDILVCADNDQWKTAGNAGLRFAEKCASEIERCRFVYPSFKNITGEPTDFNDLFLNEGEETVLIQLGEKRPRIIAKALGLIDPTLIPKREFLYGNHLIRRFCSTTISPGGVGKTQVVMTDAISMVSGIQLLHDYPHEKVRAWHYNLEDPMDELVRRAVAICQHHRLDINDFSEDLFLNSGREQELIVLEKTRNGDYAKPQADELYQAIKERGISSLSIDPFVRTHHADENSNKDIDEVLKIFGQIANDTNCAIDLVHHVKKGPVSDSHRGSMDAARGASSLAGAVRSARTLSGMSEDEAAGFGIEAVRRSWYLRIDNAKANMSAPAEKVDWMERHSVELPNGDHVGVVGTWKPPSLFEGIKTEDVNATLGHMVDNFVFADVRQNPSAQDVIIQYLNVPSQQANKILDTWLKSGKVKKVKDKHPETGKTTMRVLPK